MTNQMAVWRIGKLLPLLKLIGKKAFQVGAAGILYAGSMRSKGLNKYLARTISPARPSCNLDDKLKGTFGGPQILHPERQVCIDHTHEGDVREVQPLGNHLGSDQYIDLPLPKVRQDLPEQVSSVACDYLDSELFHLNHE